MQVDNVWTVAAGVCAAATALLSYLKSRHIEAKVQTVKVLVNGYTSRLEQRVRQLSETLEKSGVAVPPPVNYEDPLNPDINRAKE